MPKPNLPSSWKLRLWESLELRETPEQLARAIRAFESGQVEIPDSAKPKVKNILLGMSRKFSKAIEFKIRPKKTEGGKRYPPEAYAYVPDPEKPSTWKLRMWDSPTQKETPAQIARAVAALSSKGFRGNRVEIPRKDLPKVKRNVRQAWRKANRNVKDKPKMPRGIR